MNDDFIGGLIAVVAAFASIFGVNLQKYSHSREATRAVQRPYHLRPLWWVGMICVVSASLGDFLALGFAPQTLVASLGGGSTILGNCLLSRFWLKQALYITDIVGVLFVTLGVITLAAASVSEPGHYKMDKIYQLMQAAPFILYCLITTAFVMTLYLRVRRSKAPALRVAATSSATTIPMDENKTTTTTTTTMTHPESVRLQPLSKPTTEPESTPTDDETQSSSGSSTTSEPPAVKPSPAAARSALMSPFPSPIYGETLSMSPACLAGEEDDPTDDDMEYSVDDTSGTIQILKKPKRHHEGEIEKHTLIIDPKLPLYWAAISGTIGAQSMLLAKCVAEMISSTIQGDNQFVYFGTYVIVGAMVATLLSQTHTMNRAIESGDTMSAYPVFQAFWISMSNISGIVFFQQTSEFTSTQWTLFPTAIVFVILGMTLIAKHEKFGNRVKYSIAMPISLSSPRQHDIVAQSFVFRVLTPQRQLAEEDFEFGASPRRRRASVDVTA